eukprot:jgi/Hompol1/3059/HPOL_000026-RA
MWILQSVGQLEDSKLLSRQKAIVFLADLAHSPANVVQAIDEDLIGTIKKYLSSDDITCRQKAAEVLKIMANHAVGRKDIITNTIHVPLSNLFDDSNDLIRKHVYDTFAKVSTQPEGVEAMTTSGIFVAIVNRIAAERMDVQVPMLETCYNYIRHAKQPVMPAVALECHALEVFTELARKSLVSESLVSEVKVAACRCIMMLSFYHEAKQLATEGETVLILIGLLSDRKSDVRAAAAGALMSITIHCDAKRIMVRENALSVLTDLLSDSNELVLLNVIKTITNCAEDYRGRFQLHHCIRKLFSDFGKTLKINLA